MNALRSAYTLAPAFLGAYGVLRFLDGLDGVRGPGLAWTTGHLCFLAALVFFVAVLRDMRVRAGRGPVGAVAFWAAIAGTAALAGQFVIDIVVGFLAADHAAMSGYYRGVRSVPGTVPVFYSIGPLLFFVGLVVLATLLAVRRRASAWVPVLTLLGSVLPFATKDLITAGAVLLFLAFVPLRQARVPRARPGERPEAPRGFVRGRLGGEA